MIIAARIASSVFGVTAIALRGIPSDSYPSHSVFSLNMEKSAQFPIYLPISPWRNQTMLRVRPDDNSAPLFGGSLFAMADPETARTLLADSQAPAAAAPVSDAQPTVVPPASSTRPDQSVPAKGDTSPHPVQANQQVQDLLAHAKKVQAHLVSPGEVIKVDDVDFNRQPAWNPHVIQKGPVDTVDDIFLDRQGNLTLNPNKKANATKDGTIQIGVEADEVHWSPLFLPLAQEETIRDTMSWLRAKNPQMPLPPQLSDVPWVCLTSLPAQGQPDQAPIDPEIFKKQLDMHKLTDRIVAAVAGNEGNLTTVTTNDAGFGWSVGMRQWNQHVGELPVLLGAMYQKDPCKFVQDFGPYARMMINNVSDPAHATVNEAFIRHADFSALLGFTDAKHKHVNHVQDVEKALNDFQDVQVALSRQLVDGGIKLAKKYGFQTELGWAEVCDIVNQKGAGGAEKTLRSIPSAANAKENDRIKALENAAHRPGGQMRLSNLERQFSGATAAVASKLD